MKKDGKRRNKERDRRKTKEKIKKNEIEER